MFQVGDRVVYGQSGVCDIVEVSRLHFSGLSDERLYYTMKPVSCEATIFVPVDTQRPMRPLMSSEDANALIDSIPSVRVHGPDSPDIKRWVERYRMLSDSRDCVDLLELVMLIYAKKVHAEEHNRNLGQIDQNYMKNAEALLHGELAAALDIERDAVPEYIKKRIAHSSRKAESV